MLCRLRLFLTPPKSPIRNLQITYIHSFIEIDTTIHASNFTSIDHSKSRPSSSSPLDAINEYLEKDDGDYDGDYDNSTLIISIQVANLIVSIQRSFISLSLCLSGIKKGGESVHEGE